MPVRHSYCVSPISLCTGNNEMAVIKDLENTEWLLEIDAGAIRRVKSKLELDLTLPHDEYKNEVTLCEQLIVDIPLMLDVIGVILAPQVEAMGLSVDDFYKRFKPVVIRRAIDAFQKEWMDFFQTLGRSTIAQIIAQALKVRDQIQANAAEKFNQMCDVQIKLINHEVDTQVAEAVKQAEATLTESGANSIPSPDDSESATSTT